MLFRIFHRCLKCNLGLWFSPLSICAECERQIAVLEARRALLRAQAIERRLRWNKAAPFVPRPHPPEPALNGNPFYVVAGSASSIDADNPLQERRAAAALLLSAYAIEGGGDFAGAGATGDFHPLTGEPRRPPPGPPYSVDFTEAGPYGPGPAQEPSCGPAAAPEDRQATPPAADSCCAPSAPPDPPPAPAAGGFE
jgi:hypothetical protein